MYIKYTTLPSTVNVSKDNFKDLAVSKISKFVSIKYVEDRQGRCYAYMKLKGNKNIKLPMPKHKYNVFIESLYCLMYQKRQIVEIKEIVLDYVSREYASNSDKTTEVFEILEKQILPYGYTLE